MSSTLYAEEEANGQFNDIGYVFIIFQYSRSDFSHRVLKSSNSQHVFFEIPITYIHCAAVRKYLILLECK